MGVSGTLADALGGPPALTPPGHIKPLTGVRGVAALWVAGYHLLLPAGFVGGAAARMLGRGYLAVDLFFILSGFVMALNYGALFRHRIRLHVFGQFILRRAARLYPVYAAILVFRFCYTLLRYGSYALPRPWIAAPMAHPVVDIPANLLLVQAWGICAGSIGPAWSISTEWGAYFAFPALASLGLWRGRRHIVLIATAIVALLFATSWLDTSTPYHVGALDAWDGTTAGPMMRCLGGFALGVLTWRAACNPGVARLAGSGTACAGSLAWILAGIAAGVPDAVIYPAFPPLVLCLACGRNIVSSLFAAGAVVWLGEISYSLYLLHIFLLHPLDVTRAEARLALPPETADALTCIAMFALLLAASALAYRLIERPGRTVLLRGAHALGRFRRPA